VSRPRALGRAKEEIRALFEEITEVDWQRPEWRLVVSYLAASEVLGRRAFSPEAAVDAYVSALGANSTEMADTFMAAAASPPPSVLEARIARAVRRARAVVDTLDALGGVSDDQRLARILTRRRGWLVPERLAAGEASVAFIVGRRALIAQLDSGRGTDWLERALLDEARGRRSELSVVDETSPLATRAAVAIAIDPVEPEAARSFHRRAWTRGGGPWMGVADCAPFAVVSTSHVAVDGYVHAKVVDRVLEQVDRVVAFGAPRTFALSSERAASVGFAACRVPRVPRFAAALHAFAAVLDRHAGRRGSALSVPFHVPIAPGAASDDARWRRRPLYGILALAKGNGLLESRAELAARLPDWIAREAAGSGLLTRFLRATLELPAPRGLRRFLLAERGWTDRLAPARVLTGGGYLSWMRFEPGEAPARPIYPSAIPSFATDRGGAGLSVVVGASELAVGLTTSGSLGTSEAATRFLSEWVRELGEEKR